MQLINWSTLSQGCLISQVTYFTIFFLHFKAQEPNGTLQRRRRREHAQPQPHAGRGPDPAVAHVAPPVVSVRPRGYPWTLSPSHAAPRVGASVGTGPGGGQGFRSRSLLAAQLVALAALLLRDRSRAHTFPSHNRACVGPGPADPSRSPSLPATWRAVARPRQQKLPPAGPAPRSLWG
jgi:hypothetical protein